MKQIGLIDIGSNTVRLVLFTYTNETGLKELQNIKTPARLARFLDEDNVMSEEGIQSLMLTLTSYKDIAEKYGVDELYPVATAAIRQSVNVDEIIKRIKDEINLDVRVITGDEEAYFGYHAAVHTLSNRDGVTIDIGGGSTELTFFEENELVFSVSLPFGVVTLKELFFKDKKHSDKQAIKETKAFVKEHFDSVRWLSKRQVPIIAIGGSARNVARIHQSMTEYPIAGVHGYSMDKDALDDVYKVLTEADESELDDIDGLSKDRSDIILPSVIVFKALYEKVGAEEFKFSRKGLREGMAMSIISKDAPEAFSKYKVYEDALKELANDFNISPQASKKRSEIAETIYYEMERLELIDISKHDKHLMKNAAKVFYLGEFIDRDATSQHTYYLIANSNINGITHRDRVRLALMASYKNKTLLKFYAKETGWFDDDDLDVLQILGGILKFSDALNISNTGIVKDLYFEEDDGYVLNVIYHGDPIAEKYQANRQKKHVEKTINKKLTINFIES